jgi:TPR repeat protein
MAENGWGQPQSYAEAFSWYYKAAQQGNDTAQENIGYMFQHGTGVPVDYDKARAWYYAAADQGNGDAENQLGWMYQFGQGVQQDDAEALAWYQLSADQGNSHGQINLQALMDNLDYEGGGASSNATSRRVTDPAYQRAQHWTEIRDLRARITGLEADAVQQDELAYQLEHTGNGKTDSITKVFNAMGSVGAVKFHVEAAKYRAEAARLRDQLAQLESQTIPTP